MSAKDLKEKILERWSGLRIAEEAVMVDDLSELLQINRESVKAHNRTHLDNYEDGDMGNIHVGDVVNHEAPTSMKKGAGKGMIATMVLGALAGGGGLGYFAPLLLGNGSGASSVLSPEDSDTRYILGLGKPDKQEAKNEIPKGERQDQRR